MEWLAPVFSLVCGQNPAHTWAPGGVMLPCCQRCTGLYAGTAAAVLLQLLLQPRLTSRILQLHGLFLLQMVPFGFHWLPQGAVVRTLTGLLFGFGVVAFLFCLPRARWPDPETPSGRRKEALYWCGFGATVVLLPAWASRGGPLLAKALGVSCFCGLLALAALVVVNLGLTLEWAAGRLGWRRTW